MSATDLVKQHPIITGVSAIVVIGGAFLLFGGSSSGEETGPMTVPFPQGGVNADNANLAAQYQLQALKVTADNANLQIAAQKEISLADIAKQVTIAQYQKDTAFHVADVTGLTAQKDIAAKLTANLTALSVNKALTLDKQSKEYLLGVKSIDLAKYKIGSDTTVRLKQENNKRELQIQQWDLNTRLLQIEATKKKK